jgi:UDP-MurNAc hydroxylase
MRITFLGQAGLYIETAHGTILCDPWFNPAYYGSWFPFPRNDGLDRGAFVSPDYLYISHQHRDHLDPVFLACEVSKETTVLLPDFPIDRHEQELRSLGFTKFELIPKGQVAQLAGLRVAIDPATAEPTGDSALIVDDGETRILNQNDSHPLDIAELQALGPFDAHFVQFSGANWYPMVYRFPNKTKAALARKKRRDQENRAAQYIREMEAAHVFPTAGPPCFLDAELFHLNDIDDNPYTIFYDQTVFLRRMQADGNSRGRLTVPGTTIGLRGRDLRLDHPLSSAEIDEIFVDKRRYLEGYARDVQPLLDKIRSSWTRGRVEILPAVREWFEPLLELGDTTCAGVNARVLLDCGQERIVIDFLSRRVYEYDGESCRYRFYVRPELLETVILERQEDWVNSLFLSCRFEAERDGRYNEWVYNFFKGLTPERLQYLEGIYAETAPTHELWECDGYLVQRRCPHFKADLTRFGTVENGVLTCSMHGWQFELATGRCLTSDDRKLYTKPLAAADDAEATLR